MESTCLLEVRKQEQECFLTKLSALMTLESPTKLAEGTPLTFLGKSVELSQAERSISLQIPLASYQQLLEQHGLEDATTPSSLEELDFAAPSRTSTNLDARQSKLYRETVGALSRMALTRPDAAFAIQQLRQSLGRPTENDEVQLRKVLGYLRGTQAYTIKLQPPRRWTRAKSFDLLAFASTSWTEARKSTFGVSLFLMGVPLAASSRQQATRVGAAELTSVGLACAMAAHTKILLQQLGFDKPMSLRVLTGGSLAMQLGLSKHHRHVQLDSLFGQFQLSKVQVHQDFAAMLTYNPPASELHWLLPKLKMHIKTAEARALPTVLCEKEAFFLGSPCSFYIGVVSLTPMMAQLDLAQLERTAFEQLTLTAYATQLDLAQLERIDLDQLERDQLERIGLDQLERIALEELSGKELEKPSKIPELQLQQQELAKMTAKSLEKIELEKTALHMSLPSLLRTSFSKETLTAEGACMTRCLPAKPDEGRRASALGDAAWHSQSQLQLQFLGKELVNHLAVPKFAEKLSLTSVSGGASGALAAFSSSSSTKPPRRTLHSFSSVVLSIFLFILMVSSLTLYSLSFHIRSLDQQLGSYSLSFHIRSLDQQLGSYSLSFHIRSLDQQLGSYSLSFHIRSLDQQLGSYSLSFHIRSLDQQLGSYSLSFHIRSLDKKQLETKNEFHQSFENMILKKLVALMPEKHFALAASSRLLGNEAWEEHREASKEISFDKKKGDKELPHQLRRQELDCKDLRSDSFRALCPTSFEENSFTEETFSNTSLEEETFQESSLATRSKKQLDKKQLDKKQLDREQLDREQLLREQLLREHLLKEQLLREQLRPQQLGGTDLQTSSFQDSSLEAESFDEATSKPAAWRPRASRSQLRREQLRRQQLREEQL